VIRVPVWIAIAIPLARFAAAAPDAARHAEDRSPRETVSPRFRPGNISVELGNVLPPVDLFESPTDVVGPINDFSLHDGLPGALEARRAIQQQNLAVVSPRFRLTQAAVANAAEATAQASDPNAGATAGGAFFDQGIPPAGPDDGDLEVSLAREQ